MVAPSGEAAIAAIHPAGVFTNLISDRHRGVMGSPRFVVDGDSTAWIRLIGGGQSTVRYAVQYYPRSGTVYPISNINNQNWYWHRFNLKYWQGDQVHLELATAKDAPLQVRNQDRSWFGIQHVVVRKTELGPPRERKFDFLTPLFESVETSSPKSKYELALCYVGAAKKAIDDWQSGKMTNGQAMFLNALVRDGVLSNRLDAKPDLKTLVQQYRDLESRISLPIRVPGVAEADAFDQPLFTRGDHRKPADPVRRRFLEAIDATPYQTQQSGRLELANDLFRDDNPLTSRVIVNRIWLYLFGAGLVSTPDNFGQLGSKPSHPELLDYLATQMVEKNWSIKDMIRLMVSSKTWQQSSLASEQALAQDPENRYLTHANLQRLDAESIRDAAVMISGQLDGTMYGPGFPANSNSPRRSVYVLSRRNNLDKFLEVFDSPIPFSTTGRRSSTNVPAQSLTLLNSPFVIGLANGWAAKVRRESGQKTEAEQIAEMFEAALGRPPESSELSALVKYLAQTRQSADVKVQQTAELKSKIDSATKEIREILSPVSERLLKQKSESAEAAESPAPLAHWKFSEGTTDLSNQWKLDLKSGARIEDGKLVLDGNGFALSQPLPRPIAARTLEAWVQLDNLKQKGGGVVTIQELDGNVFDSIVFAELENGHWLAGSEFHRRTVPFGGEKESSASESPVYLAITYAEDGTITGYRNGKPYGKPIRKSDLRAFDRSQIVLGIRHGIATTGGRMLKGKISEVRLYDRALEPAEIAASFGGQPYVGQSEVWAELDDAAKAKIESRRELIRTWRQQLKDMRPTAGPTDPLARVAHAIINLKEFIYVR